MSVYISINIFISCWCLLAHTSKNYFFANSASKDFLKAGSIPPDFLISFNSVDTLSLSFWALAEICCTATF
jgi:hypothetical protein